MIVNLLTLYLVFKNSSTNDTYKSFNKIKWMMEKHKLDKKIKKVKPKEKLAETLFRTFQTKKKANIPILI